MTGADCENPVGPGLDEIVATNAFEANEEGMKFFDELFAIPITATEVISQHSKHTFGTSLRRYIRSKIPITPPPHPSRVIVRPYHPEEFHLSVEKPATDEIQLLVLNRRRPFFRYREATSTLEILCIPGTDWIRHYAVLIASYYRLGRISEDPKGAIVTQYVLPRKLQCDEWLSDSNLRELEHVDTVVLGYIRRFRRASSKPWQPGSTTTTTSDPTKRLFDWQIHHASNSTNGSQNGGSIAFLDCRFNFWGDIAGALVRVLHQLGKVRRQVLYIGKAGSLRAGDEPNAMIATGNESWVGDARLRWDNAFQQTLDGDHSSPAIQTGPNVSVYSPLEETHEWLSTWGERCRWVDCEVGHLASACVESGISFGYLNIVSDNVAQAHEHDLTNEELEVVRTRRQKLLSVIESTLDQHLGLHPASAPYENNMTLDLAKQSDTNPAIAQVL